MKSFYQILYIISVMSSSSSSSSSTTSYNSKDRDDTGVPVTCSKCNEIFQSDSDYVVHYNELHADIGPE